MFQVIADALSERGYEKLTAVQDAVTNPELNEKDLLVSAQTGSGKTVAFGMAIAPTLLTEDTRLPQAEAPLALIIAPTRELALQVKRELSWLYAKAGARLATCVGGMDMRDERRALDRGAHIVVGTPGRLRDHIQRGSLDMRNLRAIVLDEADEMLDLGFREDLEFMLSEAPEDRRTLLFSATVPPMIAKLAQQYQRDAARITTISEGGAQHSDISYQAMRVAQQDTENAIINLLRYQDAENAIVFANTRAMVNRLTARLTNRGFSVVALSGELSQSERSHALQAMRDGRAKVCVATDVAARGIDLPKLELVIHAELPSNAEGLLHRSGRTGRAGRKGISALIVPQKIAKKAERLLKFARIQAEWTTPPSAEDVSRKDEERLLADPIWSTEPTVEQRDFAAKLLELHSPEAIAVAYLALHRSRLSAPEDLAAPGARPERAERPERSDTRDHASFGPSVWFALSVGRDDRAEPRWILPLLCRAGDLDKEAIGAIRVQQSETFVELKQDSVEGFLAALGDTGELESGVKARKLDAAPDTSAAPRSGKEHGKARPNDGKTHAGKPYQGKRDTPQAASKHDKPARPSPAAKQAPQKHARDTKPPHKAPASQPHEKPATGKPTKFSKAPDGIAHHGSSKSSASTTGKPKAPAPFKKAKPAGQDKAPAKKPKTYAKATDTSKRFKPPTGNAGAGKAGTVKSKSTHAKSGAGAKRPAAGGMEPPRRSKGR